MKERGTRVRRGGKGRRVSSSKSEPKPKLRWLGAAATAPSTSYKKLSPSALRAQGISPKAERYQGSTGEIISKRQYQQRQLLERTGGRVSLVQRARNYLSGLWKYLTQGARRAAEARRAQNEGLVKAKNLTRKKTRSWKDNEDIDAAIDKYGFETVMGYIRKEKVK